AAGTVAKDSVEPLTARHTFRTASNTKTYVAAAMLRLIEMGRLRLDDPLSALLPEERASLLKGDGYDLDAMTLRMVLSHTSGLGDHSDDGRYDEAILADPERRWTADEQIRLLVEWRRPVGAPGEKYSYSDSGYILLGGIIEQQTGLSLGTAVRELLEYDRLGLSSTYWEYTEEPPAAAGPRAHQYYGDLDTRDWHASLDLYGGGGIVADAPDLARFMRRLLEGEVLRQEAALAAMMKDGTPTYRLGLMVKDLSGYEAFGHQGFWNTFAFHVPALDLTVSGCILDHFATNGRELAAALVAAVAEAGVISGVVGDR
ncbi:MAG: serine hydrolase domain-containing protein, partial [Planctomycetota bacterium]